MRTGTDPPGASGCVKLNWPRDDEASRLVSGAYTAAVMAADADGDIPWLASVFVPGPALDEAVELVGPLPEPAVRRLAAGLAVALQEIHRVGLIHRDLKPSNVLLTDDGPRVIDFGIAHAAAHSARRFTQTGTVIGSPGYLSPEQIDARPLTPATDVFALGGVLAFAAAGTGPFGEHPAPVLLYRVATTEPDLSRVPPGLRPLLAACLAKQPEQRPTPAQLLQALGPLPPGRDWLPTPIQQMITSVPRPRCA
jgi:serine/threonine protein kinase